MSDAAAVPPDAATFTAALVIADIVHELRRALRAPIFHIHKGGIAPLHQMALTFGWLRPLPAARLELTDAGMQVIARHLALAR